MTNKNNSYKLIFFFCFSVLNLIISQNFNYQDGDWYIITESGSINSIAETPESILYGTDNGIYIQNRYNKEIIFDYYNSQELVSKKIYNILYDKNTDYYWIVHDLGISYKASISKYWRDLSFSELKLNSFLQIEKIGYNSEAIWIKYDFGLIALDRFNASLLYIDKISEINWGSSKIDSNTDFDLLNYHLSEEWFKNSKSIINKKSNIEYFPTVKYENDFGETWFGTDSGLIFFGKYGWLESAFLGFPQKDVTEIYLDDVGTWWFAQTNYKSNRIEKMFNSPFMSVPRIFLSRWDEVNNDWEYYFTNESVSIRDVNINTMIRFRNKLYLGTLDGILILDLIDRNWSRVIKGLKDNAVWDMSLLNETIYIATAKGINRMEVPIDIIVPGMDKLLDNYNNKEIYKLDVMDDDLFIMSEIGLSSINFNKKIVNVITNKSLKDFEINNNRIFINDGQIWEILYSNDKIEERLSYQQGNDFCISNNFLWIVSNNNAKLIDLSNQNEWLYSSKDGIQGDVIYNIDCDDEWVWFGTNSGVSYYNWKKFH